VIPERIIFVSRGVTVVIYRSWKTWPWVH